MNQNIEDLAPRINATFLVAKLREGLFLDGRFALVFTNLCGDGFPSCETAPCYIGSSFVVIRARGHRLKDGGVLGLRFTADMPRRQSRSALV